MPFFGIRIAFAYDNWEIKVNTLNCAPLESHTAEVLKSHIKEVVFKFFKCRVNQLQLHSIHDDAANMMKTSELLNTEEPQHCIARAIYILLSENGMKKVAGVQNLLQKTRSIVTALTYKSYSISKEVLFKSDIAIYDKLHQLAETHTLMAMDEQFPLEAKVELEEYKSESAGRIHRSLKMQVVTIKEICELKPEDASEIIA